MSIQEAEPPGPRGWSGFVLTESRWLRFATFTAFYFAQGVPIGLLTIALPAWMAQQGRTIEEIAGYSAVVGLPWGIKLVMGPFMDRFTYLRMGFRRPWVLLAQFGLVVSFIAIALAGDLSSDSLTGIITLGFICNAFAATQDVAVDGMAIDVLPLEDRGRANAFMACGQRLGFAAFGALTGTLLVMFGLTVAALTCAITVGLIFLLGAVVLERPGEKRLPWTRGDASGVERATETGMLGYVGRLVGVLFMPMSLLLIFVEFLNRVRDGYAVVILPTFATTEFGVGTDVYTQFNGGIDLAAAVVGVCIGPFIDKAGAKRFLLAALVFSGVIHVVMALMAEYWQEPAFVLPIWIASVFSGQVIFIAIIAMFMNICSPAIAATQFAIYMSLANLSSTAGSGILAQVGSDVSFESGFLTMGLLLLAAAAFLIFFKEEKSVT